jgi:glutamine synthetase type III
MDKPETGPHPNPFEDKMEPECRSISMPLECAAYSIAISMKRIADQLDGTGTRPGAQPVSIADILQALPYITGGLWNIGMKNQ